MDPRYLHELDCLIKKPVMFLRHSSDAIANASVCSMYGQVSKLIHEMHKGGGGTKESGFDSTIA